MIKVLVVDDSPTVRAHLIHVLEEDPDIRVVGQAMDGLQAVEMTLELHPDMITMDVVMPGMDGLEATLRIMSSRPTPILIVTAHTDSKEMNVVFEAMKAGALDVISKPMGHGHEYNDTWLRELVEKVKALARIRPQQVMDNSSPSKGIGEY